MSQLDQIHSFLRLAGLCGASETLQAAMRTGLIEALQGPPRTAAELSESCRMDESRLRLVLDVLVCVGAVEQYGDDYALSTAMRLAGEHPRSLRGEHWRRLPEFLDRSADDNRETEEALHAYRGEALSRQWTMTAAAMQLGGILDVGGQRKGCRLLDLGGGSAMWSCALAYRDPGCRVTLLDVPDALPAAQRTADEIGIGERVELQAGDFREADLAPEAFDLALAVDLLTLAPLDESRSWLERVRQCLRSGGELVVVERMEGQPRGDLHRTLSALELAIRVPGAAAHPADAMLDALRQAGFQPQPPQLLDAPPYSLGAILARRA